MGRDCRPFAWAIEGSLCLEAVTGSGEESIIHKKDFMHNFIVLLKLATVRHYQLIKVKEKEEVTMNFKTL